MFRLIDKSVANLEEKAINWYFAGAFRKVILSVSGIKSGKIFNTTNKMTNYDNLFTFNV